MSRSNKLVSRIDCDPNSEFQMHCCPRRFQVSRYSIWSRTRFGTGSQNTLTLVCCSSLPSVWMMCSRLGLSTMESASIQTSHRRQVMESKTRANVCVYSIATRRRSRSCRVGKAVQLPRCESRLSHKKAQKAQKHEGG